MKFVISKPLTIVPASQKRKVFIIKVKIPRVKILIGSVKMSSKGRRRAFKSPKIREVISADQIEANFTPGTTFATIKRIRVFKSQRRRIINLNIIYFFYAS